MRISINHSWLRSHIIIGVGTLITLLPVTSTSGQNKPDEAEKWCNDPTITIPPPKGGYIPYTAGIDQRGLKLIGCVPAYTSIHGCGPTAAGMIIGYYDGQGFDDFIPGDASTQTTAVNQAIATDAGPGPDHFSDYSLPIDYLGFILPDKSELPLGDEHASNCLADFLRTSWSIDNMPYRGTYFLNLDNGLTEYTDWVNTTQGVDYQVHAYIEYWPDSFVSWERFTNEISHDRPMILFVDIDGNGYGDHFVTAIGWRNDQLLEQYACLDTSGTGIRWEVFLEAGYEWGIVGAVYFVADCSMGIREIAKFTADNAAEDDFFGHSVSVHGNHAIVGAPRTSYGGTLPGSAFVFDVMTGEQIYELYAADAVNRNKFGCAVSIYEEIAIVGAYGDVDGGSAYVFDVITGDQLFKLTADDATPLHGLGCSVSISGDTAIIGAPGDNHKGSAYLFDVTTGQQLFKLTADDAAEDDQFGYSVSINGDAAVVGARGDNNKEGSAYLFDVTTGRQLFKLTADDTAEDDWFGHSVSINGDIAIVGAPFHVSRVNYGSVYVFDATTGEQIHKLTDNNSTEAGAFGYSISIDGDIAIIGELIDGARAGEAYLFDVITGQQMSMFTSEDGEVGDWFGCSVSISGDTAVVGARYDDDACPGNPSCQSGAVYLFDLSPTDCDENGIPDLCDITFCDGSLECRDCNENGIPDGCEGCHADLNYDGVVNIDDFFEILGSWGSCNNCPPEYCCTDLTEDCITDMNDYFYILGQWGPCP